MGQLIPFPSHRINPASVFDSVNGSNIIPFVKSQKIKQVSPPLPAKVAPKPGPRRMTAHPAGKKGNESILETLERVAPTVEVEEVEPYRMKHLSVQRIVPVPFPKEYEMQDIYYHMSRLDAVLHSMKNRLAPSEFSDLVDEVEDTLTSISKNVYNMGANEAFDNLHSEF